VKGKGDDWRDQGSMRRRDAGESSNIYVNSLTPHEAYHAVLYCALRAVPWARALPRSSRERRYRLLVSLPPLEEGEGESLSRMICGLGVVWVSHNMEGGVGVEDGILWERWTEQNRTEQAVR
jgi:hypothetical protein